MFNLRTFTILGIVIIGVMNCSPTAQIDVHALKSKYQLQLARYLVKDADVYNHIRILDEGIKIYESAASWSADEYEFFLPWDDLERYKQLCEKDTDLAYQIYNRYATPKFPVTFPQPENTSEPKSEFQPTKEQPLKGLRIALDAGHIAGDFKTAKLEGKYIEMTYKGEKIAFWEADLAWHTQNYLQRQLEKHGAIVFITRAYGKTAFGMDYDTWYARFDGMEDKPDKSRMFWRYFRHKDNDERVRMVNAFKPDLTLIMHYNVDGSNKPWKRPIRSNYSMAFTGGAYMNGELFSRERRFNLLRFLLTDDIEESAKFSYDVLQNLQSYAGIPIHPAGGSQRNTVRTNYNGVYARNLSLSGRIYGTLCYAEPLFQDSREEVLRLNKRDYNFEGQMIPSRIIDIATSYEKAILKYAKTLE
ncbi:MAG: hypothetical protein AB8G11_24275 [Saprospiraceae bacterium]